MGRSAHLCHHPYSGAVPWQALLFLDLRVRRPGRNLWRSLAPPGSERQGIDSVGMDEPGRSDRSGTDHSVGPWKGCLRRGGWACQLRYSVVSPDCRCLVGRDSSRDAIPVSGWQSVVSLLVPLGKADADAIAFVFQTKMEPLQNCRE